MNSGAHRGVTVVTVLTLIFAPVFKHNHWVWKLVGKTRETHTEKCVAKQPCPFRRREVRIVTLPTPASVRPASAPTASDSDLSDDGH
jgi:N-acyl-L-homoserine lactone synthetase